MPSPTLPPSSLPLPGTAPLETPPSVARPTVESDLLPLPSLDQSFSTSEEGIIAINTFARSHGRARSAKVQSDEAPEPKQRSTSHVPLDRCTFGMVLRLQESEWVMSVKIPYHDHPPCPASGSPIHRALELAKIRDEVEKKLREGITASRIIAEIHEQSPESCLGVHDIYNVRGKMKMKMKTVVGES
ncbi:hypothetical protein N7452_007068 [Penicillium brevicompactum]|uniref:Uncharacterized protein n=1 Tax=Penicillium brevicompactum TaxID=5074 RepID=A0A9W9QK28_PENBR|nr:hypothetical protein N7452_007068 [Penicillium brevicompactum]